LNVTGLPRVSCSARLAEKTWDKNREYRSDDHRDDTEESQMLPAVVDDEQAHQRDGRVDDSVYINRLR
jgi:hypothetical protein